MRKAAFVAMPWENAVAISGVGTVSRLLGLVAAGMGVMWAVVRGRARRAGGFLVGTMFFLLWGATTVGWTIDPTGTVLRAKTYAQLALMVWLFWELADTTERHRSLLQAYVLGASCTAVTTIWNYVSGAQTLDARYTAAGFNANDLATVLVLAIPIAWHLSLDSAGLVMRWVNRLYLPLAMAGVVLTASRGALIAGMVALTIVPLTARRLPSRDKLVVAVFLVLCVCVVAVATPETSWQRFGTTGAELESGNISDRGAIWAAGSRVFLRHPMMGIGIGAYPEAMLPELGRRFAAHNSFLVVLVEQGALGLVLFLMLFLLALRPWEQFATPVARFRYVLLATLMIGIVPLSWDYAKPTWFILAMLAAQIRVPRQVLSGSLSRDTGVSAYRRPAAMRPTAGRPDRVPWAAGGGR